MELEGRLRAVPLFRDLSDDQLHVVAHLAQQRDVSEGTTLAGEGSHGYFFFVIEDGSAEISQNGTRLGRLGPGDFFGEIAVLERSGRRTATVVAASDMRVLAFFGADFHTIEALAPGVGERVRQAIEKRLAPATP
jgi:voltage-gated potassium channel